MGSDAAARSGTCAWKGIPIANAPPGDLRWLAPVDPDCWHTARLTQQFSPACLQYGRLCGPGANGTANRPGRPAAPIVDTTTTDTLISVQSST